MMRYQAAKVWLAFEVWLAFKEMLALELGHLALNLVFVID